MSETETKHKANQKANQKARESCIFRVFTPLYIRASRQWIQATREQPAIVDLSDVADEMILWLLKGGAIETADGTPVNIPVGTAERKPCPCGSK